MSTAWHDLQEGDVNMDEIAALARDEQVLEVMCDLFVVPNSCNSATRSSRVLEINGGSPEEAIEEHKGGVQRSVAALSPTLLGEGCITASLHHQQTAYQKFVPPQNRLAVADGLVDLPMSSGDWVTSTSVGSHPPQ
eukprot:GHVS01034650.1.p1 GENE.GHVS01034650.1~~GHVS01034650.1.p1  ORF type:complete len:136 (+),score=22.07 GHVS01034650.1:420-827(+)